MSLKQSCPIKLEELSFISLDDDVDGNDNCIAKSNGLETNANCLDSSDRERSRQSAASESSVLVHQGSWESDVLTDGNIPDEPEFCKSAEVPQRRRSSAFDDLLFEIYDRWHYGWRGGDAMESDTYTDVTAESDAFVGRTCDSVLHGDGSGEKGFRYSRLAIESKGKKFRTLWVVVDAWLVIVTVC
jgi:hypothetical protein